MVLTYHSVVFHDSCSSKGFANPLLTVRWLDSVKNIYTYYSSAIQSFPAALVAVPLPLTR